MPDQANRNEAETRAELIEPALTDADWGIAEGSRVRREITIETLEKWLSVPAENEHLEFKEASKSYRVDDVLKYCVALSNEGGGHFILGVTNDYPRKVIGTQAFASEKQLNKLKLSIVEQLHIRVNTHEIMHCDGRVLVFEIPARPAGQALSFKGRYLMRVGESLVSMTPDRLKEIFAETNEDWFVQTAMEYVSAEEVIALLDTKIYFDLLNLPYPTQLAILQRLEKEGLVQSQSGKWAATNLGAILLAKDISQFSIAIARKADRFVLYDGTGTGKTRTRKEVEGESGYVVRFENLVNFVHNEAPRNYILEETVRIEQRMFPKPALRELIANALIHQDFSISGASVMIEMYTDRVEISNPGKPIIQVDRFIDGYRSRNEQLAGLMRRLGICEEKGSGIDKVIQHVEAFQLPAPDFREDDIRTTVVLYSHVDFSEMSRQDRIRACYQHCCLRYVSKKYMTNASLRKRFQLADTQAASVSHVIAFTKESGLIRLDERNGSASFRYTRYLPFWA